MVLFLSKTQTATLKVRLIFNVPESTALCIFRSTSVPLPPTSSRIVTSSSRDHPRRVHHYDVILLHLIAWELLLLLLLLLLLFIIIIIIIIIIIMIRRYGDMKLYIMPLDTSTGLYSTLWLTCLLLLYQVQFQNMMVASASIFQVEPVLYAWLGENIFFSPAQI